jgi:uncharacterized protein (TIGR03382 family)
MSAILCVSSVGVAGTLYSDGFEASAINPFWTVTGPGTVSLTNVVAQGGSQALQLTLSPAFPWAAGLTHDFATDQYGTVSVYFQITQCCGFSANLEIDSANGDWIDLERVDSGATDVRISITGVQTVVPISFAAASWQFLELSTSAAGVVAKLNGTTVLSDFRLTTFRDASVSVWGGPSGTAFFDTFNANTTDAVPEPATGALAVGAVALIVVLGRRRVAC